MRLGKWLSLIAGAVFALTAAGASATTKTSSETKSVTKSKTAHHTTKTKMHSMVGTVTSFDAGKSIEVEANGKKSTFDLDDSNETVNVASDIAVGSKVKVVEKTDKDGKKTISVALHSRKMSHKSAAKSSS
jgi:hypothetical protein